MARRIAVLRGDYFGGVVAKELIESVASGAPGKSVFRRIIIRECREPTLKRFKPLPGSRLTGVA